MDHNKYKIFTWNYTANIFHKFQIGFPGVSVIDRDRNTTKPYKRL